MEAIREKEQEKNIPGNIMGKHDVRSQIDSNVPTEYIQHKINLYTTLYVKRILDENDMVKKDKLKIIDEVIECVKKEIPLC